MKTVQIKKAFKPDLEKARRAFQRAQERLKQYGSPLDKFTKEEIIQMMRKTREQLWKEKLAFRH